MMISLIELRGAETTVIMTRKKTAAATEENLSQHNKSPAAAKLAEAEALGAGVEGGRGCPDRSSSALPSPTTPFGPVNLLNLAAAKATLEITTESVEYLAVYGCRLKYFGDIALDFDEHLLTEPILGRLAPESA
jgi:hypothetical protein